MVKKQGVLKPISAALVGMQYLIRRTELKRLMCKNVSVLVTGILALAGSVITGRRHLQWWLICRIVNHRLLIQVNQEPFVMTHEPLTLTRDRLDCTRTS